MCRVKAKKLHLHKTTLCQQSTRNG